MRDINRIGLVSWDYVRPKGGMGRSLSWIVSALRAGEIIVRVGSPMGESAGERPLLPVARSKGGHLLFSFLLPFVLRSWTLRHGVTRLLLPVGPGGVLLWHRPSVPFDAIVYHTYLQQWKAVPGQRWKHLFVPFERRMLGRSERIFCFCKDTARVLREGYGIAEEKVQVLPHAVSNDQAPSTNDQFPISKQVSGILCVCVARLEERKGVRVLLEAWKDVIKSVPNARLVIVGRGKQARSVDRSIAAIGASVRRVPMLPQASLQALVSQASIALCPAYLEGFGLAAAEAMMAGTAVIASDADGLRSLIDHERTGLLVAAGDAPSLAAAIVRLLSDDALRDRLADSAQQEARMRFDAVQAAGVLVAAYDSCTIAS